MNSIICAYLCIVSLEAKPLAYHKQMFDNQKKRIHRILDQIKAIKETQPKTAARLKDRLRKAVDRLGKVQNRIGQPMNRLNLLHQVMQER